MAIKGCKGEHTGHGKNLLRIAEAIRLGHSDWEPNDTEQKVDHYNGNRKLEDRRIQSRRKIVDRNGDEEEAFRYRPNERPPLDIINSRPAGEFDLPYVQLRNDIVRSGLEKYCHQNETEKEYGLGGANLAITGRKCHPGGTRPPSDYEAKEPGVLGSGALGGPYVDGATQRQGRTDLRQNSGSNHHEHDRDQEGRPG